MKPVKLNGDLLREIIEARFAGGISDVQDLWPTEPGPARATIYRWMKGGLPQSSNDFLRLCATLDVDPFSLLIPNARELSGSINALLAAFYSDLWTPALAFMKDFLGRRAEWPPLAPAIQFYQRNWITFDFVHSATSEANFYALLSLTSSRTDYPSLPTVCHFAYRNENFYGKRWLHYGFVQQTKSEVKLIHINGHFQDYKKQLQQEPARVETFFGPSPTQFRVASLHPFSIQRIYDSNSNLPSVRFPL